MTSFPKPLRAVMFSVDCYIFEVAPCLDRLARTREFRRQVVALLKERALSSDIRHAKSGKPYLNPGLGHSIGIAHADTADVFIVGNRKYIGVDAEATIRPRSPARNQRLLKSISSEEDAVNADVLTIWTLKEAVLKTFAFGLSKPMNEIRLRSCGGGSFEADFQGKLLRLKNKKVGDLNLSLAYLDEYGEPDVTIHTTREAHTGPAIQHNRIAT